MYKENEMGRDELSALDNIVVFALDEPRYAFPLSNVERVIRAVEVIPLPKAPGIVLGVINLQGHIIPVVDICTRFGLPWLQPGIDNRFIIIRTPQRFLAVEVRSVESVKAFPDTEITSATTVIASLPHLRGVAKTPGGLILIYDIDRFLSIEENQSLDTALLEKAT